MCWEEKSSSVLGQMRHSVFWEVIQLNSLISFRFWYAGSYNFTHILNAEFSDRVVHQHRGVLHRHPDVAVHPAAFFRPILITFLLVRESQQRRCIFIGICPMKTCNGLLSLLLNRYVTSPNVYIVCAHIETCTWHVYFTVQFQGDNRDFVRLRQSIRSSQATSQLIN